MGNEVLDTVSKEIEQKVYSDREAREYGKVNDKDEPIDELLQSCEGAIDSIKSVYVKYTSGYQSKEDYETIRKALAQLDISTKEYDEKMMEERKYRLNDSIESTFPYMNTERLNKIFSIEQNATMKVLPYLISAYYIDVISGIEVFPDTREVRELLCGVNKLNSQHKQWIQSICKKLSLEYYIESQCNDKKRYYLKPGTKLDRNGYIRLLLDTSERQLSDYHAAKIIQAFIYALFAHQCTLFPQIDKLVDYKLSFQLYNEHTCAFYTRYSLKGNSDDIEGESKSNITADSLFFDDGCIDQRLSRILARFNTFCKPILNEVPKQMHDERECVKCCGLDRVCIPSLEDNASEEETEKAMYRFLAGVFTVWLHPIFGERILWPTLYSSSYSNSGLWRVDKKNQERAMNWEKVLPFFQRNLSKSKRNRKS